MESVEKHIQADKEILKIPQRLHSNAATSKKNFMNLKFTLKTIKKKLKQVTITTPAHLNCFVK